MDKVYTEKINGYEYEVPTGVINDFKLFRYDKFMANLNMKDSVYDKTLDNMYDKQLDLKWYQIKRKQKLKKEILKLTQEWENAKKERDTLRELYSKGEEDVLIINDKIYNLNPKIEDMTTKNDFHLLQFKCDRIMNNITGIVPGEMAIELRINDFVADRVQSASYQTIMLEKYLDERNYAKAIPALVGATEKFLMIREVAKTADEKGHEAGREKIDFFKKKIENEHNYNNGTNTFETEKSISNVK